MNVQIMQCPSCGSPLPAPAIGTITSCSYCGARLEVTKGASGSPMAKLSEIKEDTSFIAKEHARDHLRERVLQLEAQRDAVLKRLKETENRTPGCSGCGYGISATLACLILAAILSSEIVAAASPFLGMIVLVFAYAREDKEKEQLVREQREAADPILQQIQAEWVETMEAWQRLEQELNALARKV